MELRQVFDETPDLLIVWVMSDRQINERSRRFIDELGLSERVLFLVDPSSRSIQSLGLLKDDPEPIEKGVPHPTTMLVDREGRVRLLDVREDYHIWLDPGVLLAALSELDRN